jgi:hypothetical protein
MALPPCFSLRWMSFAAANHCTVDQTTGWTQVRDMHRTRLAAQEIQHVSHELMLGETVKWSVCIAVHEITAHVSFLKKSGGKPDDVLKAQKLGDTDDHGEPGSAVPAPTNQYASQNAEFSPDYGSMDL